MIPREEEIRLLVREVVARALAEQADAAKASPAPSAESKRVAIGADPGGLSLKQDLAKYLAELGYVVNDCGTCSSASDDYVDVAYAVARMVGDASAWRGIAIDGAGIGSAMVGNKVPGVRAALCYDLSTARNAREHNDANMLTLGARLIGAGLARDILKIFLETECSEARHLKRVAKIMDVEKRYLNSKR
jgi:RpiB/LacA/LacB family sugar-phosphate isomerase